ncbi:hypothetical protein [Lacimicrobium alkaliphilum]|uniref:Uncharacterized protein n=1 Tax=Lacimicrobium alkaliphilum TaxID=1526571 RepID=A0A0U2ZBS0_9ALTE|nr:hypothetical protein [Lacimicrobium alkaliphilum]ALS99956.1 hypothetical protein AT746_17910 [Lacimicrobium alkaliphilum]
MSYKVNHYAAKTTKPAYMLNIEMFALEAIFGVITTIFSIGGFKAQVPQLAFPCAIVALVCWGLIAHSIYLLIVDRAERRRGSDDGKSS